MNGTVRVPGLPALHELGVRPPCRVPVGCCRYQCLISASGMRLKTCSGMTQRPGVRTRQESVLVCTCASRVVETPAGGAGSVKTIGVLGGGQLGLMMAEAAKPLGLKLRVLDPTPNCPASSEAEQVLGSFRDAAMIASFAQSVDMLTVEIEHVDADALESAASAAGIEVHPSPAVLRVIQDKWRQKQHFAEVGVPCAPAAAVDSAEDLAAFGERHGYPFMLKARRLAYDGRGNAVVRDAAAAPAALAALGGLEQGLYAEAWVPFRAEVAVMVSRGRDGALTPFPLVQTLHRGSICIVSEAPAAVDSATEAEALRVAQLAVGSLPGAGVYGVEMFVVPPAGPGGATRVLLNEVAPRPHNSGHYTIEACGATDQYDAHLRAVTGRPIPSTDLTCGASIMVNVLGDSAGEEANRRRVAGLRQRTEATPGATFHWYGKREHSDRRKLGHFTITAPTRPEARRRLAEIDPAAAAALEHDSPLADAPDNAPLVGIVMGSDSDLPTMRAAAEILAEFGVPVEVAVVSAHRTPELMADYAHHAAARGLRVVVAGAGGAAHLPGMIAAMTPLPVIGVPVVPAGARLDGVDALLSICQMPRGVPVATVAIGNAANAGLLAVRILGAADPDLRDKMERYQAAMTDVVMRKRALMAAKGWQAY